VEAGLMSMLPSDLASLVTNTGELLV
jgi:hypothetical protein